jgi:peptidoglycan/LPS O-acetylase OafA/YrhL
MALPQHMPALDGLRGVAILMVVATHVATGWPGPLPFWQDWVTQSGGLTLPIWAELIALSARNGVQLFFVVSAFTLTVRAVQNQDQALGAYALRRIARIGPGYWLAGIGYTFGRGLGAVGLGPHSSILHGMQPLDLLVASVFGSAWQGGASLDVVPGGWSVSCEVAFYFALPLLIRVIGGNVLRSALLTTLTVLAALLLANHYSAAGHWNWFSFVNPVEQAPVFLMGVTAAYVAMQTRLPNIPGACLLLLVAAIVGFPLLGVSEWYGLSHLYFAVVVAAAVALAATHPPAILVSRMMRRLGEVSYSMYLLHFAVLSPSLSLALWLAPAGDWRTGLLHMAVTCGVSFLFARVTYEFIERPAVQWAAGAIRRSRMAFAPAG